jgi:hypothetical protein
MQISNSRPKELKFFQFVLSVCKRNRIWRTCFFITSLLSLLLDYLCRLDWLSCIIRLGSADSRAYFPTVHTETIEFQW